VLDESVLTLSSATAHQRRRQALAGCGLDPELAMARGTSYANEVWIGDDAVLRVNYRDVGRLAREARIAARLSREARYPEVLAVGDDDEIEWMLCRKVPGLELGRAWQRMTPPERERAIHELAAALAAIHATPCDGIPDDLRPPHTLPLEPLLELIDEAPIDSGLAADLAAFVRAKWPAFDDVDRGLVHGDPHLENVLWDGEHVSAVLDLEWSRPSWIHADLETLLAVSGDPALFASADHAHAIDPADYVDIPVWLRAAQPAWITHPRLADRIAVLYVSRTLGCFEDGYSELRVQHLREALSW
jgi:aminoglycoside phosphotransferase